MLTREQVEARMLAGESPAPGYVVPYLPSEAEHKLRQRARRMAESLFDDPDPGEEVPDVLGRMESAYVEVRMLGGKYGLWPVRVVVTTEWAALCDGVGTKVLDALGEDVLDDKHQTHPDTRVLVRTVLTTYTGAAVLWGMLWSASEKVKEEFVQAMLAAGAMGRVMAESHELGLED